MTQTKVDGDTGEVVVIVPQVSTDLILGGGMAVMSPEQAKKAVDYLQDIKKSILKDGIDYGRIPGTNKDVLYKAGAQKLCAFFNLAGHYTTESATEIPKDNFYSYRIRCVLHHRATNEVWGTGIGICMNTETKKANTPANTLIKMAEKRAYLQATLDATFSSELFTQDLEDIDNKPSSEQQYTLIVRIKDDINLDIPEKLLEETQNFLMDTKLQTNGNAKLLIGQLNKCPKRTKKVG